MNRPIQFNPFRVQFSLKVLLAVMVVAAVTVGVVNNRRPVEVRSSTIRTVQYNGWHQRLEIGFVNGSRYRYFEVPRKLYHELLQAESHGSYFHRHVRKGGFDYEKIQ